MTPTRIDAIALLKADHRKVEGLFEGEAVFEVDVRIHHGVVASAQRDDVLETVVDGDGGPAIRATVTGRVASKIGREALWALNRQTTSPSADGPDGGPSTGMEK